MGSEAERIETFDWRLLQIGDGSVYDDKKIKLIKLPPDIFIAPSHIQVEWIVDAVYPSLLQKYSDPTYLKERDLLTPKNEIVHDLKEKRMNTIHGEGRTYYNSNNVCKASVNTNEEDKLYPTKFLITLRF